MNRQNVETLISVLEAHRDRFDMKHWAKFTSGRSFIGHRAGEIVHDCGSVACLGGWTNAVFNPNTDPGNGTNAAKALDFDREFAGQLFIPWANNNPWAKVFPALTVPNDGETHANYLDGRITVDHALVMLRLIAEGSIDAGTYEGD